MASNGNERYLRYILLLGEGVLLVLRGIVQREVHRTGLTLDAILTIPNNRGQIESNCHSETQRLHLFPSTSTVNSDIETWDISLLTLVIQRVFWSNLSRDERVRISYLRDSRNEYQGHPPQMSMESTEYTTRAADLTTILQDLASGMDQQTRDKLTRIINDSNAVQFDFHTAIQNLQHLYEFREDMLRELETKFHDVNTKLDTIQDESSDHKKMTRDMGTLQGHMHDDLLDIKSLAEENNRTATSLSKTLDDVKETVSSSRERDEQQQETLRHIEQMMTELMSHQGDRHLQHDIDANININSERPENANEAQDIIVTNINDILKEIRPDAMDDRDLAEGITQRVNELITRYEGSDYELTKALLELIKDIIRHGHIQQVKKGSIKLTVRFTSYRGLQSFVQYLNSEQFQDRLNDISRALKNRTGHVVTLSAYIAQESLYALLRHLEEECKSLKCTRSVVMPVQCKGIMDLNHIWKLLQTGGADRHMDRLSEILTKIIGSKVTLTTSVDLKQFELALIETESGREKEQENVLRYGKVPTQTKHTGLVKVKAGLFPPGHVPKEKLFSEFGKGKSFYSDCVPSKTEYTGLEKVKKETVYSGRLRRTPTTYSKFGKGKSFYSHCVPKKTEYSGREKEIEKSLSPDKVPFKLKYSGREKEKSIYPEYVPPMPKYDIEEYTSTKDAEESLRSHKVPTKTEHSGCEKVEEKSFRSDKV